MRTPASKNSALASATIAKLYMISLMSFWTAYRFRSGPPGVFLERHQRWTEYGDWTGAKLGGAHKPAPSGNRFALLTNFSSLWLTPGLTPVEPAGNGIAQAGIERDLGHAMKSGYLKHIERIERRHKTLLDVAVTANELKDAAPIGTPGRRHVEDVSRKPIAPARFVVVHGEKIPRPIQGCLRVSPFDRGNPRDLAREIQHRRRVQERDDSSVEARRIRIRLAIDGQSVVVEEILKSRARTLPR